MRRFPLLITALFAAALFNGAVGLAEDATYAQWRGQTQNGDMQQLLMQLRALTAKAERDKAADPRFLDDLRKLADGYDSQWPARILFDDFRDNDFTSNPPWTVRAGTWRIGNPGNMTGLQSRVRVQQNSASSQSGSSTQNAVVGILGALLQQQQGGQTQQATQDQYAGITTAVAIPNAFAIRVEIASRQPAVRFDFGPYRGTGSDSGYYLTYMPAAANGLTLSSVVGGAGVRQLASSNGPVHLEDNAAHVIDWKRDREGKMTVALDGKVVIQATDLSIRKGFDGFVMGNGGGIYTIRSVTIDGSR
jgi:hypothetical protein